MPLGRCDICASKLRLGRVVCDRCGARKSRTKAILGTVVLLQAVTIGIYMYVTTTFADPMKHVEGGTRAVIPVALNSPIPPAGWLYYETRDDLVGDVTRHARVLSLSDPQSGKPRSHGSTGVLELRASLIYGNSVIITLRRQAFDNVDETCVFHAQFDAEDPVIFKAAGAADTDTATLIVVDTKHFLRALLGAHTLSVDAHLSPNTERIASFDITGLRWN
jgi:hypothetical protein